MSTDRPFHRSSPLDVDGRWPAVADYRDRFEPGHLPPGAPRDLVTAYGYLAQLLIDTLPDGPLLVNALHDLWRSKNEAVLGAVRQVSPAEHDGTAVQ